MDVVWFHSCRTAPWGLSPLPMGQPTCGPKPIYLASDNSAHSIQFMIIYFIKSCLELFLLWFMDGVDQQVTAAKEANTSIDELEIVSKPTRHPMDLIVVQPP